jgi:hypothetical protein
VEERTGVERQVEAKVKVEDFPNLNLNLNLILEQAEL